MKQETDLTDAIKFIKSTIKPEIKRIAGGVSKLGYDPTKLIKSVNDITKLTKKTPNLENIIRGILSEVSDTISACDDKLLNFELKVIAKLVNTLDVFFIKNPQLNMFGESNDKFVKFIESVNSINPTLIGNIYKAYKLTHY